jgi:hypothetical protein
VVVASLPVARGARSAATSRRWRGPRRIGQGVEEVRTKGANGGGWRLPGNGKLPLCPPDGALLSLRLDMACALEVLATTVELCGGGVSFWRLFLFEKSLLYFLQ